jgi:hypothetical protein
MRATAIIILTLVLISGCAPGIDPGPCRARECLNETYSLRLIRKVAPWRDTLLITNGAEAEFKPADEEYPYDRQGVNAGSVKVNAVALRQARAGGSMPQVTYTIDMANDSMIAPPGEMNIWRVEGSLEVAPLTLTMATPAAPLAILYPSRGDTVDADSVLVIRWSAGAPSSDSQKVMIELREEAASWFRFRYEAVDDGETQIPIASILASGVSLDRSVILHLERTSVRRDITADAHLYGLYFVEVIEQRIVLRE